ncbi:MAG: T9SS type A sorting domain-containing protein [Bacteroidetes bacterium]|nr:MAG: T9SS type A sorting domain-containing protein [Bacteroidota bacterium]
MHKILLSFGLISLTALSAIGQMKITLKDSQDNLSGGIHSVTATDGAEQVVEIQVHNESTKVESWYITRVRMNVPNQGWEDYLCWGSENDPLGGSCYTTGQMMADVWDSPESAEIAAQEAGLLQIHINPDDAVMNNGHYRYYVGREPGNAMDSVDVVIHREDVAGDTDNNGIINGDEIAGDTNNNGTIDGGEVVGDVNGNGMIDNGEVEGDVNGNGKLDASETSAAIEEINVNVQIGLYPNPATEYIVVKSSGVNTSATIRITDVLGKEVKQEQFKQTKKIRVEDLKNGIYIMSVVTGNKTYSKRFVVKHN